MSLKKGGGKRESAAEGKQATEPPQAQKLTTLINSPEMSSMRESNAISFFEDQLQIAPQMPDNAKMIFSTHHTMQNNLPTREDKPDTPTKSARHEGEGRAEGARNSIRAMRIRKLRRHQ